MGVARLLWSARSGEAFDASAEFRPWDPEERDFGPLFLNVALCLLPGVVLIIARVCFVCQERVCLPSRDLSIASLELKQDPFSAAPVTHVLLPGVSPVGNLSDGLLEGVTHVYKNTWASWRRVCNGALAASSAAAFLAFMLAGQLSNNLSKEMPVSEALGCACLTVSAICAISFYRKDSSEGKGIRTRAAGRRLGLRIFWVITFLVVCLRLQTACRHWRGATAYTTFWKVAWLLVASVQFVIATAGLLLSLHADTPREDPLEHLRRAFEDVNEAETDKGLASLSTVADPHRRSPEENAGFIRMITFTWMESLIRIGRKRLMSISDLPNLMPDRRSAILFTRFNECWRRQRERKLNKWTLPKALFKFAQPSFTFAAGIKILYDSLSMLDPLFLNLIVNYMRNASTSSTGRGIFYVFLLAMNQLCETALLHQYFHRQQALGIELRSALSTAVYEKSLRIDRNALQGDLAEGASTGKVSNLMTTDTQRLGDLMNYVQIIWSAPYQIILIAILLYRQIGWAAFCGIAVMILSLPITSLLTRRMRKIQKIVMAEKDNRVKTTTEMITGIRAVKLYAWEDAKTAEINAIRRKELTQLWRVQMNMLVSRTQTYATPCIVALVSFGVYIYGAKRTLDPATAFTALALFNSLRFPLVVLPNVLMSLAEAVVTAGRLQSFLILPELKLKPCHPVIENEPLIELENVKIQFPGRDPIIEHLSLPIKKGELVCVVGRTGCGKSSLINAVLGDMALSGGRCILRGSIAFCAQNAWIQSGSVKDNILFGRKYERSRYARVVEACALKDDFAVLIDGDATEIGERGINLSGGQKQRIALARAVYRNSDVYILDDVLSAVDTHVAEHIFKKVCKGLLARKAVLLVTHRLEFLHQVNSIVFLHQGDTKVFTSLAQARENKNFVALAAETHADEQKDDTRHEETRHEETVLLTRDESDYRSVASALDRSPSMSPDHYESLCKAFEAMETGLSQKSSRVSKSSFVAEETPVAAKQIIEEEMMKEGRVSGKVYVTYFKAAGGWWLLSLIGMMMVGSQVMSILSGFWLSHWSDSADLPPDQRVPSDKGLGIYGGLQGSYVLLVILGSFALAVSAQKGSQVFHERLLHKMSRATIGFFESTPIGRMTNKVSKDLYVVDDSIPQTFYSFLQNAIVVASVVTVICVVLPILIVIVVPAMGIYFWVEKMYVAVARQIKRIDSVSRSPVFSHFAETLDGVVTIRACREIPQFRKLHLSLLDTNLSAAYIYVASNRWLAVRLETIGTLLVVAVTLGSVLARHKLSPALSGLAISYAISVTNSLNWLVRMSGDREANIVSVERLMEFEDPLQCPQEKYENDEGAQTTPSRLGEIEFVDVSLKYRPELPYALKQISFHVKPGEKVGVVGRTGAGKSSLTLCLLKIVEATDGEIRIHGNPIGPLSVTTLRQSLAIIPQDAVLFTGSIRDNLDPFHKSTDEQIWEALRRSCLLDFVKSQPNGLAHLVVEAGSNLSAGQRQLVCLARVLLSDTRILLLDEATSAVDPQTDALIQTTIRAEFAHCTVLTIAHRLKTVIDYDKILVMAEGRIVEYGNPQALLRDPQSIFMSMYNASNAH